MIRDFAEHHGSELPPYDLCIVGTGPAGLALAHELSAERIRICLLESGGTEKTKFGDELRRVSDVGIKLDRDGQERGLGGTSETWSGLCAPLDAIDFEQRAIPYHIGWPVTRAALDPSYARASDRYKFPHLDLYKVENRQGSGSPETGEIVLQWCEEKRFFKPSPIYRFGSNLKAELERSDNVDVLLHATVTTLVAEPEPSSGRERITAANCRTAEGREYRVRATWFVLAAGGIENARLLLGSRGRSGSALGNEHDQVGRYLMNHPKGRSGIVRLAAPMDAAKCFTWNTYRDGTCFAGLRLREDIQRSTGILNSYVLVTAHYPWSNRGEPEAFRAVLAELRAFLPMLVRRRNLGLGDGNLWRSYFADLRSLRVRWRPLAGAAGHALVCLPMMLWLLMLRIVLGRRNRVSTVSFVNFAEMSLVLMEKH